MNVAEVMRKDVVAVEKTETLSKALAKMKKGRFHQLPVVDGGAVLGIIELKDVVTRDIDVKSGKVEHYTKKVRPVSPSDEIDSVIEFLLNSGIRAAPVIDKGKLVGIISESDAIKFLSINSKKTCGDIAVKCEFISKKDAIGKVKRIMTEKNVSRVPVLENNRVTGVVGTLDLIKLLEGKETLEFRGKTQDASVKEKTTLDSTGVESFVHECAVLKSSDSVENAIKLLQQYEEVIVINGDLMIITPKDVLELMAAKPKKQVYVQTTGLHGESSEVIAGVDEATTRFAQKIGKMVNLQFLFVHVERQNDHGGRDRKIRYSMRARASTQLGLFVSHGWGWRPTDVIQDVLRKLEREILKKYEQVKKHGKARKSGDLRKRFR